MDTSRYKELLVKAYGQRNANTVIRLVNGVIENDQFTMLLREWIKEGRIAPGVPKTTEVAEILLQDAIKDIEKSIAETTTIEPTYYEITAELRKALNDEVADIYEQTKMPTEFLSKVRFNDEREEFVHLSESLVNRYKNELIRVERGRRAIIDALQQASNFPIRHVVTLSRLLNQLHARLKASYKYVSIKPYLMPIYELKGTVGQSEERSDKDSSFKLGTLALFKDYVNDGLEPDILEQLKLRLAVDRLLQEVDKPAAFPDLELNKFRDVISKIWAYRSQKEMDPKTRGILENLLVDVNNDQEALLKQLAQAFVDEYNEAEHQMKLRHGMIQNELAYTREYLKQTAANPEYAEKADVEKLTIAQEKLVGLSEIFQIAPALEQAAAARPFMELERSAIGISTAISASQITDWIRIYSILFSNNEFLRYAREPVNFSIMRAMISDLSTYHLIHNIATLKTNIDRAIGPSDEEKTAHFKRFNDALKSKLMNLWGGGKREVKSIQEMIEDLGFLDNQPIQFVVADTFKGFQTIADAFAKTATDYFVKDRDILINESRELYYEICDQCMKSFTSPPKKHDYKKILEAKKSETKSKKSFLGRFFSD